MDNLNGEEIKPRKKTHKFLKGLIVIVFALVTYFAAFYLGNNLATKGVVIGGAVPQKAVADLEEIGDSGKYSNLFNLRSMLFSMYDGEIDDEKLLEGAMKGMANAVGDPYTVYMDKEEFNKFMESSQGSFYGIGAQLGVRDNNITIIAPVEGSPAEQAGLKAGDIILKVDDYEVTDLNTEAVVSRVRGNQGEPVTLTIKREGIEEPFEVTIVRAEIKTESVKGEIIEDGIGYIQISTFSDEEVSDKFTEKLNELKNEKGIDELGFKVKTIAEKFVKGMRILSNSYIDNKTKLSMQFLADIMKNMSYKKLITKKDLYELSEKEVMEKIENCTYNDISKKFDFWKNACEIKESDKKVKGKYCININAKIRYINPLVNGKRISEISEIAKEEIQKAVEFKTQKYAYLDFDNF